MNTAPHEFVTVDMRGLKAALFARAREQRISVSAVVRDAVARVMPPGLEVAPGEVGKPTAAVADSRDTVKISMRFSLRSFVD